MVRHCGAVAPTASSSEQCFYKDSSCATSKPSTCAATSTSADDGLRFCPCRAPTAMETVPATKATTVATPTVATNGNGDTTAAAATVTTVVTNDSGDSNGGGVTTKVRVYPSVNFYATTEQQACTPGTVKCKCDERNGCLGDLFCYGIKEVEKWRERERDLFLFCLIINFVLKISWIGMYSTKLYWRIGLSMFE